MIFLVDHACDICWTLAPSELVGVSSRTHEYESVSFFVLIFAGFAGWLVVYSAKQLSWTLSLCPPCEGAKEKPFGGNNFVSP